MGQHTANAIKTMQQISDALYRAIDIDFWLYIGIAFFGAVTAMLGGNDASTFISVERLFYLRSMCAIATAVMLSAKMYRSTKFGDRKQQQQPADPAQPVVTKP
jgi:hypothetical protein